MRVGLIDESASRELRRRVLRPNLGPDDPLPGDDLPDGVHVGAVADDGAVVGTCFVYPDPCPFRDAPDAWRLRQMATAPELRGQGIGAAVLAAAAAYIRTQGASLLWCEARSSAASFYAAHGWRVEGAEFVSNDLPHRYMWTEPSAPPVSSPET